MKILPINLNKVNIYFLNFIIRYIILPFPFISIKNTMTYFVGSSSGNPVPEKPKTLKDIRVRKVSPRTRPFFFRP